MKKLLSMAFLSMTIIVVVSTEEVSGHGGVAAPPSMVLRTFEPRAVADPGTYVNYETPHVHPLDINTNSTQLAVVNTPDGHVEIFNINASTGNLTYSESIKVGMGPVSARWRTATELWVINQLSDSISIIDMATSTVVRTIVTYEVPLVGSTPPKGDEPADVVFATYGGNPYAFVSCSRTDIIQTYDITGADAPNDAYGLRDEVYLQGEDPRSLATDGTNIYAAIYESGNSTTLIFGEAGVGSLGLPSNTAGINGNNHTDHPYYIDGATELGNASIKSINPAPNDPGFPTVGPFTLGGGLGAYLAHGKSISYVNMAASTPATTAPTTSIIVRKDFADADKWKDDNGADWSAYINGIYATESGRVTGWDMLDNDVAILALSDLSDTYATRQMNICMALNISPSNGNIYMVGTEATNEVRFEPNLTGTFVRVMLSITNSSGTEVALVDLNETHLNAAQGGGVAYEDGSVSQAERDKSIGDPRGVAFTTDGATVYITGMGSNNVIALNTATNERYSTGHTIEVGQGPTGIAHHSTKDRLYVVNKFGASVSVIDTATAGSETIVETLAFHDPTPAYVNTGRVHFYGTHENSGLGQLSCASCHVDGRMDRLAWDLGNPAAITDAMNAFPTPADSFFADIKGGGDGLFYAPATNTNLNDAINTLIFPGSSGNEESDYPKFHPMKGPMTTQTLQDIIGKEPHHWRGDKDGIEEFAGAFDGLQGDDVPLAAMEMQEFEDFLATIHFPPNPFRPVDNTMPGGPTADGGSNANLDMTGFFTAPPPANANLSAPGTPMETAVPTGGDAWNGFKMYVDDTADGVFRCVDCHTLPIGAGPTEFMAGNSLPFSDFRVIPAGANGEAHQMVVNLDGTGQKHIKVPQTRNQIEKDGFYLNQLVDGSGASMVSRAGFGVLHDGAIDGLVRFLSEPAFSDINNQGGAPAVGNSTSDDESVADIVSFTLALGGADFDYLTTLSGAPAGTIPPAAVDNSAHSGVGHSITITSTPAGSSDEENSIYAMTRRANEDVLDLIVVGELSSERRGWVHTSGDDAAATFQSDRTGETVGITTLLGYAGTSGAEMTFLMVPTVEGPRRGIDRDDDTIYDGDETDFNSDSGNPDDHKWVEDGYVGTESGSTTEPYEAIDTALSGVSPSSGKAAVLHLRPGTYSSSTTTLNTPMWLLQEGVGSVTIGTP